MAVVKANAYGHGDAALIPYLERFGIDWLAVSNLDEAISLRKNGAELPIFILGDTPVRFASNPESGYCSFRHTSSSLNA